MCIGLLCQPGIAVVISNCAVFCYLLKSKAQESLNILLNSNLQFSSFCCSHLKESSPFFSIEDIPFTRHASSCSNASLLVNKYLWVTSVERSKQRHQILPEPKKHLPYHFFFPRSCSAQFGVVFTMKAMTVKE